MFAQRVVATRRPCSFRQTTLLWKGFFSRTNAAFSTSIARTSGGQEKTDISIRKMKSLGSIIERFDRSFILGLLPQKLEPIVSTDWWRERVSEKYWRNRFRTFVMKVKAANARAQILRVDTTFDYTELPKEVFQQFRELNAGLISGSRSMIEGSTTEHFFNVLNYKGTFNSKGEKILLSKQAQVPERVGRITRLLQNPEIVQTRTCRVSKTDTSLRFAQVSVLYVTEQVLVDMNDPLITTVNTGKSKISRREMPNIDRPAEWKKEISDKGKIYYWHTGTRKSQWKKPLSYGISAVHYNPAMGTLGSGRIIEKDPETNRFKVENIVVFERPLYNLNVPWRICSF
mmetsp:Transcript_14577/g.18012  ORF Transcript_14577/g.18012 Transcript_14577/m.18012 type:complete len:343 (-) Transcript_14577:929-1957(-)